MVALRLFSLALPCLAAHASLPSSGSCAQTNAAIQSDEVDLLQQHVQEQVHALKISETQEFGRVDDNVTVLKMETMSLNTEQTVSLRRKHFASLDEDGDGALTASDIQAGVFSGSKIEELLHGGVLNVTASALKLSSEEVAAIMARGDQDHSGTLTFEELQMALPLEDKAELGEASVLQATQTLSSRSGKCMTSTTVNQDSSCVRMVEEVFGCDCRWEWRCEGFMCSDRLQVQKCNSECTRFAAETYNCVVEVTETVVKAVDACIQDVIDEVLSKLPAELKTFLDVIKGCTSIDGCRRQLEGSLEALGRLVGNWLDENLQSTFSDAYKHS